MRRTFLVLCFLGVFESLASDAQDAQLKLGAASNERNLGDKALKSGQLKTALGHYSKSIELAPKDANGYYKRASALMIDRKYSAAERDLTTALDIDPNFTMALSKRARMFAAQGRFESARTDLAKLIHSGKSSEDVNQMLGKVESAMQAVEVSEHYRRAQQWEHAKQNIDVALEVAPDSVELLMARSEIRQHLGDLEGVLLDTGAALKVRADHIPALVLRGKTYYLLHDYEVAQRHFREGLRMDPEHKECKAEHKKVKLINSAFTALQNKKWTDALKLFTQVLELGIGYPQFVAKMVLGQCKSHVGLKKAKDAVASCTKQIDMISEEASDKGDRAQAFAQRAEALLLLEDFEEAVRDYERAKNLADSHEIQQGLENAKKRLKMSKRKDYYKILDVAPGSDERTIRKAYKRMALKYHPDKVSPDEKETALKKFRDVAEAHEILTDPEKRAKFDNGEDLNEQPQHHHQDPFQAFHFNFGGGGGGFHFG